MKKVLISLAAIAFAVSANAQLFIGGSLSANGSSTPSSMVVGSTVVESKPAASTLAFSPVVGYELSDKLAVGGMLSLSTSKSVTDKEVDKKTWTKTNAWSIAPFVRYTFVTFGDFALKAEAVASFGQSTPVANVSSTKTKGWKTTTIALNVTPLVTYELNEHFELEAGLNFCSLGASTSITKDPDEKDNKNVSNRIGLSANANNVTTLGSIRIGFIYKF